MNIEERDKSYLQRMVEYCERIEEAKSRFGSTFESYMKDADYRDVVCMNIFQIGELANQVSEKTQGLFEEIPWKQMYAIRNILAHAYIKIDDKIVWDTVVSDIPKLQSKLKERV